MNQKELKKNDKLFTYTFWGLIIAAFLISFALIAAIWVVFIFPLPTL